MIRQELREMPFIRFLLPFIGGIFLIFQLPTKYVLLCSPQWISIVLFCILILLASIHFTNKGRDLRIITGLIVNSMFFILGILITLSSLHHFDKLHFSKHNASFLIVSVNEKPRLTEKSVRFCVDVLGEPKEQKLLSGKLMVYLPYDSLSSLLQYGDELIIINKAQKIRGPANPGEFDYAYVRSLQNIHHESFIKEYEWKLIRHGKGNFLTRISLHFSDRMVSVFKSYLKDSEAFQVTAALLLGYRSNIDRDVVQTYADTGTIHVLSVSGLHVGIIYLVLSFLLSFLDKSSFLKIIKCITLILFVWCYALITGLSPSVCRSATMISFIISGKTLNRTINTYNVIAVSAFVLLYQWPLILFEIGFQLSYLAVIGIIYFHPLIYNLFSCKNKFLDKIWSLSSVSIAAQLVTFPLGVYYFHQFPNYFLVSNLLVIPLASILLYIGIVLLLFASVTTIANAVAWLITLLVHLMNGILMFVQQLPGATFNKLIMSKVEIIVIYVLIILITLFFKYKWRLLFKYIVSIAILWTCLQLWNDWRKYHEHKLVIFDMNRAIIIGYYHKGEGYIYSDKILTTTEKLFHTEPVSLYMRARKTHYLTDNDSCEGLYCIREPFLKMGPYTLQTLSDSSLYVDPIVLPNVDFIVINKRNITLQKIEHMSRVIITSTITQEKVTKLKSINPQTEVYSTRLNGAFTTKCNI